MRNTEKNGKQKIPEAVLLRIEYLSPDSSDLSGSGKVAKLLSLPGDEVPPRELSDAVSSEMRKEFSEEDARSSLPVPKPASDITATVRIPEKRSGSSAIIRLGLRP